MRENLRELREVAQRELTHSWYLVVAQAATVVAVGFAAYHNLLEGDWLWAVALGLVMLVLIVAMVYLLRSMRLLRQSLTEVECYEQQLLDELKSDIVRNVKPGCCRFTPPQP